jgi:hypothetical protein
MSGYGLWDGGYGFLLWVTGYKYRRRKEQPITHNSFPKTLLQLRQGIFHVHAGQIGFALFALAVHGT